MEDINKRYVGVCQQCGQPTYSRYRSTLKRFCSHACSNQWKWDNIRKHREYIETKCANCGKTLLIAKSDHRLHEGQEIYFCSHSCSSEYVKKQNIKVCPICGKKFHPKKTQTCSAKCGYELFKLTAYRKKVGDETATYSDYCAYIEKCKIEEDRRKNRPFVYVGRAKDYMREYNKRNAERRRTRERQRIKYDKVYAFKVMLRKKMCHWFRRRGVYKDEPTEIILGCSIMDFKSYVASKFKDGMCWENYGEWELDHIIPLATATTVDEVKRLNHYTNFQPLWAMENRAKSDKMIL